MSTRIGLTAPGVIPEGAGGVVGFEDYGGITTGSDYQRAYQTSMMARFAPDTLARNVRGSWDEPWEQEITPQKPSAVSLIGSDVFGDTYFTPTVRNQLHDTRGEAAVTFNSNVGNIPQGASDVGWRTYANKEIIRQAGGCGTCAANYKRKSSAQMSAPGSNPPRAMETPYRTPLSKLKAAFYI